MVVVEIQAPCRPTEAPEKVRQAIQNLFPDTELRADGDVRGTTASLDRFAELLATQRIRAAAREVLQGALRGDVLVFHLNKQAAFAGRVSFSAHAPLGDITVTIRGEDLEALVDRVAPARGVA